MLDHVLPVYRVWSMHQSAARGHHYFDRASVAKEYGWRKQKKVNVGTFPYRTFHLLKATGFCRAKHNACLQKHLAYYKLYKHMHVCGCDVIVPHVHVYDFFAGLMTHGPH